MRVVIVGGSGFVGSHVTGHLLKDGHEVVIADVVRPQWHEVQGDLSYVHADVLIPDSYEDAFRDADVVMHLAAISNTGEAYRHPDLCLDINVAGTQKVYQTALEQNIKRVVLAGSSLISGQQVPRAARGTVKNRPVVDEQDPVSVKAKHPYVASKIAAEMVAHFYDRTYGLPSTIFRYGIQYGPRMTPGVLFHEFIRRGLRHEDLVVHGNGQQWRQYTYVDDIARAHAMVLREDAFSDSIGTFNLTGKEAVTVQDVADAVQRETGADIAYGPSRPDDIEVNFCLNHDAGAVFGWMPKTDLAWGVTETVAWYRENGI